MAAGIGADMVSRVLILLSNDGKISTEGIHLQSGFAAAVASGRDGAPLRKMCRPVPLRLISM